jgi:UDP-2,3-diacylglucosamine pyrophosphatase LpxH
VTSEPLLIVSDVHLGATGTAAIGRALASVIHEAAGHELVLNGDALNLSEAPLGEDPRESVARIFEAHPAVVEALRKHLERGDAVAWVPGNHDAALASPGMLDCLRRCLGVSERARLQIEWGGLRRGAVFVEHGHIHDPDNAPYHPLAPWDPETEPLGVAIIRRFLAPQGALAFAHAHETTPAAGIRKVFVRYGVRAPGMILGYFAFAARACWRAGRGSRAAGAAGSREETAYAARVGVPRESVACIFAELEPPTHLRFRRVFLRLYLDRVLASMLLIPSLAGALLGSLGAALLALICVACLALSVGRRKNRYGGRMEACLRRGGLRAAELLGVTLVVMGHTHRAEAAGGYVNTGSFGYPMRSDSSAQRVRCFLRVEADGAWERRELFAD